MKELFESSYLSIMSEENERLRKEIERLNNIINELEKWLEGKIHNFNKDDPRDTIFHEFIALKLTYDYLQELKGE